MGSTLDVPFFQEGTGYNCAPASVQMVMAYYGCSYQQEVIAKWLGTTREKGTPPVNIIKGLEKAGIKAKFIGSLDKKFAFSLLRSTISRKIPVIVSVDQDVYRKGVPRQRPRVSWQGKNFTLHYVVVIGVGHKYVYFNDSFESDNEEGLKRLKNDLFMKAWFNKYLRGEMILIRKPD